MDLMLLEATRDRYESQLSMAKANLMIYLKNPVGVGEHSNITEEVNIMLRQIDDAQSMLDTIQEMVTELLEESE